MIYWANVPRPAPGTAIVKTMKTIKKSILIGYSQAQMYRLVTDVDQYPQFLPWCDRARALSADASGMVAEIGIAMMGLRQTFTTRNTHTPDQQVLIRLVNGPFSHLEGKWNFVATGTACLQACRVDLTLTYAFKGALGHLSKRVFDKIATNMVDAFILRADQLYGR